MSGSGAGVWIAETAEHSDAVVVGRSTVEELKRREVLAHSARGSVVEESGSGERLGP